MARDSKNQRYCSFCGRAEEQINGILVQGPEAYICSECVMECMNLLESDDNCRNGFKAFENVP